jgi:hypothetical protein
MKEHLGENDRTGHRQRGRNWGTKLTSRTRVQDPTLQLTDVVLILPEVLVGSIPSGPRFDSLVELGHERLYSFRNFQQGNEGTAICWDSGGLVHPSKLVQTSD